jgi:uncharacterized protein YndB with AHSA1/START domain
MTEFAPDYVYVTYIKSTPQKVWDAITVPEFARQYWTYENVSDWKKGSQWSHKTRDGKTMIHGTVEETRPPEKLVFSWSAPGNEANASRVSFDIAKAGGMVKLTVTHSRLKAGTDMAKNIAIGWPRVLSNLKSWLETGTAMVDDWAEYKQTIDV